MGLRQVRCTIRAWEAAALTPDQQVSMDFTETCWAFLSPSAKDFVVKLDHFLQEGNKLAHLAESLNEREQLFVRIYWKNRAIKRLIDRERGKKIDELYEQRQLSKIRRASSIHVCHGPGCPVCGGS